MLTLCGFLIWTEVRRGIGPYEDFTAFHESALAFAEVGTFYPSGLPLPNLNNPHSSAVLLGPLGLFESRDTAFIAFSTVMVALLVVFGAIAASAVGGDGSARLAVLVALFAWPVTHVTAATGQVSPALAVPLALGWWALARGDERWGGVALGIALSIKLFVGLLIPVLLLSRRWKSVAWMAGTTAVVYGVGVLLLGLDQYALHFSMLRDVPVQTHSSNASLLAQLHRMGWGSLFPVLAVGCTGALLLKARRADIHVAVGAAVAGMMLLSPLAWRHYLPLLLIPLLAAWKAGGATRWVAAGAWCVAGIPLPPGALNFHALGLFLMFLAMLFAPRGAESGFGEPTPRSA